MTRSRATADTQDNNGGSVAPFVAGKNVLLNSDFRINQRAFSSTTTTGTFGHDRWDLWTSGGTVTYSTQAFTPGAAPVAGYEAINYARMVTSGQSASNHYAILEQRIEDVRTFANQTVTVSFWAKASSGTPSIAALFYQTFGSGGSGSVYVTGNKVTLSTSWARYSITIAVPSISGKTIGTGSSLYLWLMTSGGSAFNSYTNSIGLQDATIDIWGVQAEAGSVATPFTTATGNPASELAACQRYYQRLNTSASSYSMFAFGIGQQSTRVLMQIPLRVNMRTAPSSIGYGGTVILSDTVNNVALTSVALDGGLSNESYVGFAANVSSGITVNRPYILRGDNSASAFFEINAEL